MVCLLYIQFLEKNLSTFSHFSRDFLFADCVLIVEAGGVACSVIDVAAGEAGPVIRAALPGKQAEYRTIFAVIPPVFPGVRLKRKLFQWFWTVPLY